MTEAYARVAHAGILEGTRLVANPAAFDDSSSAFDDVSFGFDDSP